MNEPRSRIVSMGDTYGFGSTSRRVEATTPFLYDPCADPATVEVEYVRADGCRVACTLAEFQEWMRDALDNDEYRIASLRCELDDAERATAYARKAESRGRRHANEQALTIKALHYRLASMKERARKQASYIAKLKAELRRASGEKEGGDE